MPSHHGNLKNQLQTFDKKKDVTCSERITAGLACAFANKPVLGAVGAARQMCFPDRSVRSLGGCFEHKAAAGLCATQPEEIEVGLGYTEKAGESIAQHIRGLGRGAGIAAVTPGPPGLVCSRGGAPARWSGVVGPTEGHRKSAR